MRPFPLCVVSFETERWRCDGAAAASSTAWRQTVNPEGGRWDTSWWKKLYFGPNDIHNIWVQPHPRQRSRPFLLSRRNIRGKRRYREHSKAHSFYVRLPNVFFSVHSVNHGEEKLKWSSPFPPFTSFCTQNLTKEKPPLSEQLKTTKSFPSPQELKKRKKLKIY